jgi:hypothetical protein
VTQPGAEKAVLGSAIVVAGVWGYRKMVEPITSPEPGASTIKTLAGLSSVPASAAEFAVGFGFTYLILSLLVDASPDLAGSFAILIATGSLLTNGQSLFTDISKQTNAKSTTAAAKTTSTTPAKKV